MGNTAGIGAFWLLVLGLLQVSNAVPSSSSSSSSTTTTSTLISTNGTSSSSSTSTSLSASISSAAASSTSSIPSTVSISATNSSSASTASSAAASTSSSSSTFSTIASNSTSGMNSTSVPLFTPTDTAQSYRAAAICTSQALSYYSAQGTTVPTNFAKIGDHTIVVPAGQTLTSTITGMDSYTNSVGSMTHPTFTFTVVGPTTTVWNDPAAFPTFDPFTNCCGYCKMPIFRPTIKYWPDTNNPPNTACLAGCSNTDVLGGTTMGDNSTHHTTTSFVPSQYSMGFGAPGAQASSSSAPAAGSAQPTSTSAQAAPTTTTTTSSTYKPPIPGQYSGVITERAVFSAAPVRRADDHGSYVYISVDPDGKYTYTSPYIYVMLNSVVAQNDCNYVGGNFTNQVYSYLPGQLSTMQFRYGTSAAFNFNDLPCPPESVRYANGWNDGSCTYQPFLAPITQILSLDSAFQDCWIPGCNLWDPPHTLTPQTSLWVTGDAPVAQPTPPSPQPNVGSPTPESTSESGPQMTPQASMGAPNSNTKQQDPGTASIAAPGGGFDPSVTASPNNQPSYSPVIPPAAAPAPSNSPTPVTVGSNTVFFHTTNVVVGTQTVNPGSAINVSGTQISLAPSGTAVVIGSSTIAIAPPSNPTPSATFTISNVGFTSSSGVIVVGSQTLSAGGPAITAGGQTISLLPPGSNGGGASIVMGSSTIALPTAVPATATALTVTAGGSTFTLSASGTDLVIGSQTLAPGGSAITQDGTVFSLPPGGGNIVVGSTTIPLAETTVDIGGAIYTAWVGSSSAGGPTASVMGNGTLIMTGSAGRLGESIWKSSIFVLTLVLGLYI